VLLAVLCALYVIPYGVIGCTLGGPHLQTPDIHSGAAFFEKPDTVVISIQANGVHSIGSVRVPLDQLQSMLGEIHLRTPDRPLEIQADQRVPTTTVLHALAIARDAGFSECYVFGHEHSLLEIRATP